MDDFSGLLLPAMAALTAATGGVSGAAVRQGATVLCSSLLIRGIDGLLVPMLYAYIAACCAHAALGSDGLKKLAALLKGTIVFLLTAGLLAFVGYLTASGAIAGSADAAAVKAAKMTISRPSPWWAGSCPTRRRRCWPERESCGALWGWWGCWWYWPSV